MKELIERLNDYLNNTDDCALRKEATEALLAQQVVIERMRDALNQLLNEAESYGEVWARAHVAEYDRIASDSKYMRFCMLAIARDRLKKVGEALTFQPSLKALREHDAEVIKKAWEAFLNHEDFTQPCEEFFADYIERIRKGE